MTAISPPTPPSDPTCIFCKIISGHIPSYKIYEDDTVFAFLDIGPLVPGHTLVVPKAHYPTLMTAPPDLLAGIAQRLPKLTRALLAATHTKACHLLVNNGEEALQSVHHLHYHILPRHAGDSYKLPWPAGKLEPAAAKLLCQSVSEGLKKE